MVGKTYEELIGFPNNNSNGTNSTNNDIVEKAFKVANACRDKEIDRFWSRGLYFWGFIVASFGAYMALFNVFLKNEDGSKIAIGISAILKMSFAAKVVLCIMSFICFIFFVAWLLVQKGSKFWQKNWERHISLLEKDYIGKLFESHLDTNNKQEFSKCLLVTKAYDYSVSKIALLCSMLLSICSFGLVVFHIILLILDLINFKMPALSNFFLLKIFIIRVLLLFLVLFTVFFFTRSPGNKDEDDKNNSEYDSNYTYFKQNKETIKIISDEEKKSNYIKT